MGSTPGRAGFATMIAVAALTIIDLSKINVAVPGLQAAGADATQVQLILAGYTLSYAIALVPAGRLGDLGLRRRITLVGIGVFLVSSVACALATDMWVVAGGRILQGAAAGALLPQVLGFIQTAFPGPERARAFGIFGGTLGVSTAAAPLLGGLLLEAGGTEGGWRLLFWVNVPLALVLLPLAARLLPRDTVTAVRRADLDLPGAAVLALAVLGALFPILTTTGTEADSPWRWSALLVAAVAAVGFVRHERAVSRRGGTPLLDLDLFRLPAFRAGTVLATVFFAASPPTLLLLSLLVQRGLGLSAIVVGLASLPFAICNALGSYLGGRLALRAAPLVTVVGLTTVLASTAAGILVALTADATLVPWLLTALLMVLGVGSGAFVTANQTTTLGAVPPQVGGVGASITQVLQRVGQAFGVAIAAAVYVAIAPGEDPASHRAAYAAGGALGVAMLASGVVLALRELRRMRVGGAA